VPAAFGLAQVRFGKAAAPGLQGLQLSPVGPHSHLVELEPTGRFPETLEPRFSAYPNYE